MYTEMGLDRGYRMKGNGGTNRRDGRPIRARRGARMPKARCSNCDSIIEIPRPQEGIILVCPRCAVEQVIVDADSLELDFTDDWQ
jgi:hypothetical protein